jgi:hypothetical protein
LKTLGTYIRNLANNPHEQKYQRINTENAAFQKRVAVFEGSLAVLTACGFTEVGAALVVDSDFLKTKAELFSRGSKGGWTAEVSSESELLFPHMFACSLNRLSTS